MKTYNFEVADDSFLVTIAEDDTGAIITSLHSHIDWERDDEDGQRIKHYWNTYVDALEAIILAHACAGIDVGTRQYIEGIQVALEAYGNK